MKKIILKILPIILGALIAISLFSPIIRGFVFLYIIYFVLFLCYPFRSILQNMGLTSAWSSMGGPNSPTTVGIVLVLSFYVGALYVVFRLFSNFFSRPRFKRKP